MKETAELNYQWSYQLVEILAHMGAEHCCISPGARNTPLTKAFLNHSKFYCTSHIDERSGGFFALGQSIASRLPTVLVSTSGTATANYLPAIIESSQNRIPLIVLTADRPPQLIGTGANQTIRQKDLYGYYIRFFKDMGLPQADLTTLELTVMSSFQSAMGIDWQDQKVTPPGPVHLNIPFDEPLYSGEKFQFAVYSPPEKQPLPFSIKIEQNVEIPKFKDALIVCGRLDDDSHVKSSLTLSEKIHAPIFADSLSQIRFGFDHKHIIRSYDHFLKTVELNPDLVIRLGTKPVSKILCTKLDEWTDRTGLIDPVGRVNDDCPVVIDEPVDAVIPRLNSSESSSSLLNKVIDLENQTTNIIQDSISDLWFEGSIAKICVENLPQRANLVIGNSMPIRYVDMFGLYSVNQLRTISNRGASGIDGVVSTALGVALSGQHTLLLIGDLSFYHDLNGLMAAMRYNINLTIVVVNNNGGGIFSFLPMADESNNHFESFWTTPHKLDFKHVAKLYHCNYEQVNSTSTLEKAISDSFDAKGIQIIEAISDIKENVAKHRQIASKIAKDLV